MKNYQLKEFCSETFQKTIKKSKTIAYATFQKTAFNCLAVLVLLLGAEGVSGQIAKRNDINTQYNTNTGYAFIIEKPTDAEVGDILIVNIVHSTPGNKTSSIPQAYPQGVTNQTYSWSIINTDIFHSTGTTGGATQFRGTAMYRIVTATDPTTYYFNLGNHTYSEGAIVAFSGVDVTGGVGINGTGSGPFDDGLITSSTQTSNTKSVQAAGIITSNNNATLLMLVQSNTNSTYSQWNNSLGLLYENPHTTTSGCSVGAAWANFPTAGSTLTGSVTASVQGYNNAIIIALKKKCNPLPTITTQPSSQAILTGDTLTLSATISGAASYQWKKDGVAIAGATSATYSKSFLPADTGSYTVVALNNCGGSITSNPAIVTKASTWVPQPGQALMWGNAANWSSGAVPDALTAVTIGSGTINVSGQGNVAYSITLNNTATLNMSSSIETAGSISITSLKVINKITVAATAQFIVGNNANLVQVDNVANEGTIKVNRSTTASRMLKRFDGVLWSSPVVQKLKAMSPETIDAYFRFHNPQTNSWTSVANPATTDFVQGQGYLIRTPNTFSTTNPATWNVQFNGVPNNGDISLSCGNTGATQKYFLVGNPYPSAINISTFLANNPNITGVMYFWRRPNSGSTNSYYGTRTANGVFTTNDENIGALNPGNSIPSGQAFFVAMKTDITNGEVFFKNVMRTENNVGLFNRSVASQSNDYKLKVTNVSGGYNQMYVGHSATATNGTDIGLDAIAFNDSNIDLTSIIDTKNYRIQTRGAFVLSDIVPLRFKTGVTGEHTISLGDVQGIFAGNQTVYLKDYVTNVTHNLKLGNYTFSATAGTFNTRFALVYQNMQTFYADVDGDGYGNPASSMVSEMQPLGYVLNNTDCDDANKRINPGEIDVCYDGIDNNCDGIIDNGCTPYVSEVVAAQCGQTLTHIDDFISATAVNNAQGYRFKVINLSNSQLQMKDSPSNGFKITHLGDYAFNTQYAVSVGVKINNVWQPFFGTSCTITTPSPSTHLTNSTTTLATMADVIYANTVAYASGYQFKVINTSNPSDVQVINREVNEFRMNLLTGISYNTKYNVQVAVKNTDGSYLPFGTVCNVRTPSVMTTSLQNNQCDNYMTPTNATLIYAVPVTGATVYRFKLQNTVLNYSQEVNRNSNSFSLSDFSGIVSGTTYSVQVSVKVNGVYGPYGTTCTITTPGLSKTGKEEIYETITTVPNFKPKATPNPFTESFGVSLETVSNDDVKLLVYDLLGKLIDKKDIKASELAAFTLGQGYAAGDYLLVVTQGSLIKTLHIIKR